MNNILQHRLIRCSLFFVVFFTLFSSTSLAAHAPDPQVYPDTRPVQVFSIKEGKVMQSFINNNQFQEQASQILHSVNGLAPQLNPGKDYEYIVRIPLQKPHPVQFGTRKLETTEMFVFYSKNKQPFVLVFEEHNRPYFFTFSKDLTPLFSILKQQ